MDPGMATINKVTWSTKSGASAQMKPMTRTRLARNTTPVADPRRHPLLTKKWTGGTSATERKMDTKTMKRMSLKLKMSQRTAATTRITNTTLSVRLRKFFRSAISCTVTIDQSVSRCGPLSGDLR